MVSHQRAQSRQTAVSTVQTLVLSTGDVDYKHVVKSTSSPSSGSGSVCIGTKETVNLAV